MNKGLKSRNTRNIVVGSVGASSDLNARLNHWALFNKESVRIFGRRTCLPLFGGRKTQLWKRHIPSWTLVGDKIFTGIWQLRRCRDWGDILNLGARRDGVYVV